MNGKILSQSTTLILFVVLFYFLLQQTNNVPPERYTWIKAEEYDHFIRKAKQQRKTVALYFHASWCGYCKEFNEDYLGDEAIYRYLADFPMMHIEPDLGGIHETLSSRFGVKGYPSFFLYTPHTNRKKKVSPFKKSGKLNPERYLESLKKAHEVTRRR